MNELKQNAFLNSASHSPNSASRSPNSAKRFLRKRFRSFDRSRWKLSKTLS
ncbi:hypothetical protein [Leptospira noguchii]|uniref:hypothetical protein n=1 Tax=Leptospira noguchii TaxID=28182 RepID=UPI001FB6332F|nr:hypothetical protein [Leptospira noguchii]UOG31700.1 hypothetical protein MAL06_06785 [Leptospira noguchii]